MHADAVEQRGDEQGVVEAGVDQRVPQLPVLMLQAEVHGGFNIPHAAQQQEKRFGNVAEAGQEEHLLRHKFARLAELERDVGAVLAALAHERQQLLRVVVCVQLQLHVVVRSGDAGVSLEHLVQVAAHERSAAAQLRHHHLKSRQWLSATAFPA